MMSKILYGLFVVMALAVVTIGLLYATMEFTGVFDPAPTYAPMEFHRDMEQMEREQSEMIVRGFHNMTEAMRDE